LNPIQPRLSAANLEVDNFFERACRRCAGSGGQRTKSEESADCCYR
jgi:hypothetical protein